jgi:hypothetical protein
MRSVMTFRMSSQVIGFAFITWLLAAPVNIAGKQMSSFVGLVP